MRRITITVCLLLLLPAVACAQSRGGWLRGVWAGTGFQSDDNSTWAMRVTAGKKSYLVEYPSLGCGGRWNLVSMSGGRAVFRERITRGAEKCAPRGNVVVERLNSRQIGFWYSHDGSNAFVASAILNKQL